MWVAFSQSENEFFERGLPGRLGGGGWVRVADEKRHVEGSATLRVR